MKNLVIKTLTVSILSACFACADEPVNSEILGYAFVISKLNATSDTVFGVGINTMTNKDFSRVTVTSGDNSVYELQPYNGHTYNFYYETPDNEFIRFEPYFGKYYFKYTLTTGEQFSDSSDVVRAIVYPADITECAYNTESNNVQLKWNRIENANFIVIFLLNGNGEVVYASKSLAGTTVSATIAASGTGWQFEVKPEAGAQYTVQVKAFRNKANSTVEIVQGESVVERKITWGQ
ncbi:MAG: hypothetical protein LBR06_01550 [Bacteroidales bacterium]|jgi:hypothetical protein|nr:hypothetical protein [Bacteroidales bacterium]